nr:metallophosphoesterase MPPED2-like [Cherax quadricarinatus]
MAGQLPHKHKVVIAGNHDRLFDKNFWQVPADPKRVLTNATYLQDQHTTIYGIKIYGAPWTPEYRDLAFNVPRGLPCLQKWSLIPENTDIVMTHGPPWGQGDFTKGKKHVGCEALLAVIQNKVIPKYHVFGHIHEGYGVTGNGKTVFVNAAMCNIHYKPVNPPIVFDLPLPHGFSKNVC